MTDNLLPTEKIAAILVTEDGKVFAGDVYATEVTLSDFLLHRYPGDTKSVTHAEVKLLSTGEFVWNTPDCPHTRMVVLRELWKVTRSLLEAINNANVNMG